MIITTEVLRGLDACGSYIDQFQTDFPDNVEVTVTADLCVEYAERYDWLWAAQRLFTEEGYVEYRRLTEVLNEGPVGAVRTRRNERERQFDADRRAWRSRNDEGDSYPSWNTPDTSRDEYNELSTRYSNDVEELNRELSREIARVFGRLAEEHPEYTSPRIAQLIERSRARAVTRARSVMDNLDRQVRDISQRIASMERDLPTLQRQLEEARVNLVEATAAHAELNVTYLKRKAQLAQDAVDVEVQRARTTAERAANTALGDVAAAEAALTDAQTALRNQNGETASSSTGDASSTESTSTATAASGTTTN